MTWSFQRLNQPILGCLSKQSTEASTVYRSQARRAGGRGRFLGRVCPCRIAHRASALGCQRLGTGARDRSSRGAWRALPDAPFRGRVWEPSQGSHHTGRVRPRKPSAPPAASARPMACGRRGVVPGASPLRPREARGWQGGWRVQKPSVRSPKSPSLVGPIWAKTQFAGDSYSTR
jgi:hypothetical protein